MSQVRIYGYIRDSGANPLVNGILDVQLTNPLNLGEIVITPKSSRIILNYQGFFETWLHQSETSGITYRFRVMRPASETPTARPIDLDGDGIEETTPVIEIAPLLDFYAVVPNKKEVAFGELIPVLPATQMLPLAINQVADLVLQKLAQST